MDTHDAVAEAFDKVAAATPAEPASASEPAAAAAPAAPEIVRASPSADRDDKGRDGRDEKGRFAKKEPAAPAETAAAAAAGQGAAPAAGVAPAAAPASAPALPELKAPADWRAGAREHWGKLPREAQEEALRLHVETKKALQDLAEARKSTEEWGGAVKGYEHLFPGQQPARAVAGLVQTYAQLHTAPLPQRAKVLASFVRNFLGTDEGAIRMLASELDGSGAPAPAAVEQKPQLGPQDLDRWYEERRQKEAREAATRTWQDFEATAEFLNEPGFRNRLAMEVQLIMQEKGGPPSKEDFQRAHDAASKAHPEVAKIVKQREEVKVAAANAAKASTQAAAASGVKSEPAGPSAGGKSKNTRDEVERQMDRLSRPARV